MKATNALLRMQPTLGRLRRNAALNTLGRLVGGIVKVRRDIRKERRQRRAGRQDFANRFASRP